jgi:hypothetical protein
VAVRVFPAARALSSTDVSHDELRALVPSYAAGELAAAQAEVVRSHIADGCAACLQEVYRHPVGSLRRPLAKGAGAPAHRPWMVAGAALLFALAVLASAVWRIDRLSRDLVASRFEAGRAAEDRAVRDRLGAHIGELEAALTAARAEARASAEVARAGAGVDAELEDALGATQARVDDLTRRLQGREREFARLEAALDSERTRHDLLGTPGVRVLRLEPAAPFREPRGHVLWHPERDEMVLYAFALPPSAGSVGYRVRLRLDQGGTANGTRFVTDSRGQATVAVRVEGGAGHLREVQVVLEPAGRPLLIGQVAGPP